MVGKRLIARPSALAMALAPHLFGRERYVMRPFAREITAGDFALAAGHDLPTLRLLAVRRRTDGAGRFFLISIRCSCRRSRSSRNLSYIPHVEGAISEQFW